MCGRGRRGGHNQRVKGNRHKGLTEQRFCMADEKPTAPAIAGGPRAVMDTSKPAFTPWTFRETKLRPNLVEAVKALKPAGNPEPKHLEIVKQLALDLIEALPAEANAAELMIEANYRATGNPVGGAIQTHVIVWPKAF